MTDTLREQILELKTAIQTTRDGREFCCDDDGIDQIFALIHEQREVFASDLKQAMADGKHSHSVKRIHEIIDELTNTPGKVG